MRYSTAINDEISQVYDSQMAVGSRFEMLLQFAVAQQLSQRSSIDRLARSRTSSDETGQIDTSRLIP